MPTTAEEDIYAEKIQTRD